MRMTAREQMIGGFCVQEVQQGGRKFVLVNGEIKNQTYETVISQVKSAVKGRQPEEQQT